MLFPRLFINSNLIIHTKEILKLSQLVTTNFISCTPAQGEEKFNINDMLNPTVTYCVGAKQKLRNIFYNKLSKNKSLYPLVTM